MFAEWAHIPSSETPLFSGRCRGRLVRPERCPAPFFEGDFDAFSQNVADVFYWWKVLKIKALVVIWCLNALCNWAPDVIGRVIARCSGSPEVLGRVVARCTETPDVSGQSLRSALGRLNTPVGSLHAARRRPIITVLVNFPAEIRPITPPVNSQCPARPTIIGNAPPHDAPRLQNIADWVIPSAQIKQTFEFSA